jgi:hypothetical protein
MRRLLLVAVLTAALGGCGADKYSFGCGGKAACTVSTTGTPTVDLSNQLGPGAVVTIKTVGDDSVTLTVGGTPATLKPGETRPVGRLKVTVDSVDGDNVELRVEE